MRMKSFLAGGLAIVTILCCAGCGAEKPTAESLINNWKKQADKSISLEMDAEMAMSMKFMGQEESVSSKIKGTIEMSGDILHVTSETKSKEGDEEEETQNEEYWQDKDNKYTKGYAGWYSSSSSSEDYTALLNKIEVSSCVLKEKDGKIVTEKYNGKECYVVEGKFDGKELLKDMDEDMDFSKLGVD